MAKLLQTTLSTSTLHFKPGHPPQSFEVTVNNYSSEFATFQLEVTASGVDPETQVRWYRLAPDLSAKIPAGDRTTFVVTIVDVPPVPGGFVGTMSLAVRVFSLELRQEDRQVLNLVVEGAGVSPAKVELPQAQFTASPLQAIEIPVRLLNPNRSMISVLLRLTGLAAAWLPDGHERRLQVPPLGETLVVFLGQIPAAIEAPSQIYSFEVEALVPQTASSRTRGTLTIQPDGWLEYEITPLQHTLPLAADKPDAPASYLLQMTNQSNVVQQMTLTVKRLTWSLWERQRRRRNPDPPLLRPSDRLTILPGTATVAVGGVTPIDLQLHVPRPWLGWTRRHRFQIEPLLSDQRVALRPETQEIQLRVMPRLQLWLQLLGLGLLTAIVVFLLINRTSHKGPVNTVQFDGLGNEVISASDDHTVKRWDVSGRRLQWLDEPDQSDKAVRVVRYRPVNNNAIAIGFENGEIEMVNLLSGQVTHFLHSQDDRVFDLEFSPDARSLFSGHGSGQVLRWDLNPPLTDPVRPVELLQTQFAVQALAVVGAPQPYLAIAGRFNQLQLWNWQQPQNPVIPVPYPTGISTDYITSLAVADQQPNRLASADNQGRIMLWDLSPCLTSTAACRKLEERSDGHSDKAVLSVALSADGCYLASGGEDGQVVLWSLGRDGRVVDQQPVGGRSPQPINSVDVTRRGDRVWVVSGGTDQRVKLDAVADSNPCGR